MTLRLIWKGDLLIEYEEWWPWVRHGGNASGLRGQTSKGKKTPPNWHWKIFSVRDITHDPPESLLQVFPHKGHSKMSTPKQVNKQVLEKTNPKPLKGSGQIYVLFEQRNSKYQLEYNLRFLKQVFISVLIAAKCQQSKPTIHRLAFDVPSVFLVSVFLIEVIKCWQKKPLFQTLLVNVYWKL